MNNVGKVFTPWYNFDFNDDNSIDPTDYNIWLSHLGAGAGSGLGGEGAVPEPAAFVLLLAGVILGLATRIR